jgi:hypothetical protein
MSKWIVFLAIVLFAPSFTQAKDITITDAGAIADGVTINTTAIQQAIDDIAESGGGKLTVPAGTFKTGALFLRQAVELHLAEGATLLGSTDLVDYPKQMTRIEGHFEPWRPALINASKLSGLRITGSGTLNGNGEPFWRAFWQRRAENPKCTNLEVERPRLMFIEDCTCRTPASGISTCINVAVWWSTGSRSPLRMVIRPRSSTWPSRGTKSPSAGRPAPTRSMSTVARTW